MGLKSVPFGSDPYLPDKGQTGFMMVPDVLIRNQANLGLNSTEMLVLLNILLHWWRVSELPHPRPSVIGKRMGASSRTVERGIQKLSELGLIHRLPPEPTGKGPDIRRFDLSGLVKRLEELAEQTRQTATDTQSE